MIVSFIAMTLDGYIADKDGGIGFLDAYNGVDSGYAGFIATVDRLVVGRLTFETMIGFGEWPYPGKETIIVSSRDLGVLPPGCSIWRGTVADLVGDLRQDDRTTWIVGGGLLHQAFLDLDAIDRLELFILPETIGAGTPLFPATGVGRKFVLTETGSVGPMARLLYVRRED